jgi:hypothetical protein
MKEELKKYVESLKQINSNISKRLIDDVELFNDSERSYYTTRYNTQLQVIKDLEQILNKETK